MVAVHANTDASFLPFRIDQPSTEKRVNKAPPAGT